MDFDEMQEELSRHMWSKRTLRKMKKNIKDKARDTNMVYAAGDMVRIANEVNIEEVEHPEHYNKGIEAIDYIESHNMNFNQGNIIKYVTRCEHKGNKRKDLEKAKWYLERELEKC